MGNQIFINNNKNNSEVLIENFDSKFHNSKTHTHPHNAPINESCNQNNQSVSSTKVPKSSIYALSAVIVHSGISSDCGHYYCYARHISSIDENKIFEYRNLSEDEKNNYDFFQNEWFLFNDSRVTFSKYESFSNVTERFNSDTAYIIFYHKIKTYNEMETSSSYKKPKISNDKLNLSAKWREMVNNDNQTYIKEQEQEKRSMATKYGNLANHINKNKH